MDRNTPVNFEIAKLLKEKGFDETTNDIYSDEELLTDRLLNYKNSEDITALLSAPTIAEVCMWLYEKHGIWITVDIDINGRFTYLLRKFNPKDKAWEVKNKLLISEYINSPTEAYEKAIKYVLTEIL